jgi:hypothetical protein
MSDTLIKNKKYAIRIKDCIELMKIKGTEIDKHSVTIHGVTGYAIRRVVGKTVYAQYDGRKWIVEGYFHVPVVAVESVYVPRK